MDFNQFNAFEFIEEIDVLLLDYIEANFEQTSAGACGLDPRAAYRLFFNRDAIVCPNTYIRSLDYYGGFEYVDEDCRKTIGNYTFFFDFGESDRVREAIDAAFESQKKAA